MVQIRAGENENIFKMIFKELIFDKNRDTEGCLNHSSINRFHISRNLININKN